jgi:uroporphyrinogen-III decarboxylase
MTSISKMTSRERVLAAAKGLPVDRIPVMYLLNAHLACKLMAEFQPPANPLTYYRARFLWNKFINGGGVNNPRELWRRLPLKLEEDANRYYTLELGADISFSSIPLSSPLRRTFYDKGRYRYIDNFGGLHGMGGIYAEVIRPAIQDIRDLKTLTFPTFNADAYTSKIRNFRRLYPDACLLGETFGAQDYFSTQLWEMSRFLMALYDYPEEIKEFQNRFSDWAIDIAVQEVKGGADVVIIYDDYGYTGKPLMSMKMWRKFTLPHLKRIVAAVHETGALAMLHSCGYQMPFLEDYVEAGVDILQAFQLKAGNNFEEAYARVGDQMAFATGIDVQLGELMEPQELREDILKNYRIGKTKGRHILAMSHMLQFTMPDANIRTIFDTVREIQSGAHL